MRSRWLTPTAPRSYSRGSRCWARLHGEGRSRKARHLVLARHPPHCPPSGRTASGRDAGRLCGRLGGCEKDDGVVSMSAVFCGGGAQGSGARPAATDGAPVRRRDDCEGAEGAGHGRHNTAFRHRIALDLEKVCDVHAFAADTDGIDVCRGVGCSDARARQRGCAHSASISRRRCLGEAPTRCSIR